ncbi:CPBP family intramembrane metalloprotease [Bacteroidales bacterium OttesenSCG-928-C03]|nr:CPBP family intramembrane metalloprotease [Bacteroidales bacterium OttesenSCG-928-E04]MDL2308769.1 CPBP family intramembrane metalloprotease [Bacteroidales bacterium OttesenSCG-928-C03]MDL2326097.1 CPBP family intramembrane metalloprotease [Bacteroidales bacterium OttesenSCG-928-A14]
MNDNHPFLTDMPKAAQFLVFLALCVGSMLLAAFLTLVITLVFFRTTTPELSLSYIWLNQGLSSIFMFLMPAVLFAYLKTGEFFGLPGADTLPTGKTTVEVSLLALVLVPVVVILAYFNEKMILPEFMGGIEQWMRRMEDDSAAILEFMTSVGSLPVLLVNLVIMAVLPAICEEFVFRGTLQPIFGEWFKNKHVAIWLTAFIFSAIHLQFYGFIPRFLLGAYLGYLLIWSGSLWLPVIAHFLHNALMVIIDFITRKAGMDVENIELTSLPGFIPIALALFALCGFGIWTLSRTTRNRSMC